MRVARADAHTSVQENWAVKWKMILTSLEKVKSRQTSLALYKIRTNHLASKSFSVIEAFFHATQIMMALLDL